MLRYRYHKGELNTHSYTVSSSTALHVCGLSEALLKNSPKETKDRGQWGQEALQNDPRGTGWIFLTPPKNAFTSKIYVMFIHGMHLRHNKENIHKHGTLGSD